MVAAATVLVVRDVGRAVLRSLRESTDGIKDCDT